MVDGQADQLGLLGKPPALFEALAKSAQQRARDFSAQDLANIAWAFANAGQIDGRLFSALASAAEEALHDFSEEDLDNAEWDLLRAGEQEVVKAIRQRRKREMGGADGVSADTAIDAAACGRIVVAGGGIGGAAAAVALQSKGFDVVVLEADRSFDARQQGYGLTIQRQDALQAMGINLAQDDAPHVALHLLRRRPHPRLLRRGLRQQKQGPAGERELWSFRPHPEADAPAAGCRADTAGDDPVGQQAEELHLLGRRGSGR